MKILWGDVGQDDQEIIISIIRAVSEDDHLRALVECAVLISGEELDQIAEVVDSIAVYEEDRYGFDEEDGDESEDEDGVTLTVVLEACGYEWTCPQCGKHQQTDMEIGDSVRCGKCGRVCGIVGFITG